MMHYTDDPVRDADNYQFEQEERLKNCPVCDDCNEYIQDGGYWYIDGAILCEDCAREEYYKTTED